MTYLQAFNESELISGYTKEKEERFVDLIEASDYHEGIKALIAELYKSNGLTNTVVMSNQLGFFYQLEENGCYLMLDVTEGIISRSPLECDDSKRVINENVMDILDNL